MPNALIGEHSYTSVTSIQCLVLCCNVAKAAEAHGERRMSQRSKNRAIV
jgi:hypothetical protein